MRYKIELFRDGRWRWLQVDHVNQSREDHVDAYRFAEERSRLYKGFEYRVVDTATDTITAVFKGGARTYGTAPVEVKEGTYGQRGELPMEDVTSIEIVLNYRDDAGVDKNWRWTSKLSDDESSVSLLGPMLKLIEAMVPWGESIRELREHEGHVAVSMGDKAEAATRAEAVLNWLQSGEVLAEAARVLAVRFGKEPS